MAILNFSRFSRSAVKPLSPLAAYKAVEQSWKNLLIHHAPEDILTLSPQVCKKGKVIVLDSLFDSVNSFFKRIHNKQIEGFAFRLPFLRRTFICSEPAKDSKLLKFFINAHEWVHAVQNQFPNIATSTTKAETALEALKVFKHKWGHLNGNGARRIVEKLSDQELKQLKK